jgi:hypothetical protein
LIIWKTISEEEDLNDDLFMAGNQKHCLVNLKTITKKFKSQLNLTEIFAKYANWQASPIEPEFGTAQSQLVFYTYHSFIILQVQEN